MKESLENSINSFLKHNKEGSFQTHAHRSKRLRQALQQLSGNYRHLVNIRDFKSRHVLFLVEQWKSEKLSIGTIKNRMSDLRWLAEKIGKADMIHRENEKYGIGRREYVKNDANAAKELEYDKLGSVTNPYTRLSLRLQESFGLRREEAIKFNVRYADKGDHIALKGSWCKGGRPRVVPVRNEKQRCLLDEVREFQKAQGATALIAPDKSYYQQLRTYENQTEKAGIHHNHGLRHQYAQQRYDELTGWSCPKQGGLGHRQLSPEQKTVDHQARLTISQELGHNREQISAVYLGR